MSHEDKVVVTYVAEQLARRNQNKIKSEHRKVFDYLGMDLDVESTQGTMLIAMVTCLSKGIKEWPEVLKGYNANPHGGHVFTIRKEKEQEILPE